MESSVAERGAIAKVADEGHEDLELSVEHRAEEAAEAAANRERELGGVEEAVQATYQRTYDETLKEAQAELDASPSRTEALVAEAGEAVGPMPPAEPEETSLPPETLTVAGTSAKTRKWSGKAPGMTVLSVGAMKIEVPEGDFRKGERIHFKGEATIVSEGVKDKLDKDTKQVTEAVQKHDAVVLDFELTDEPEG